MAFPAGVSTCTVSWGGFWNTFGDDIKTVNVRVRPLFGGEASSITHAPTATTFVDFVVSNTVPVTQAWTPGGVPIVPSTPAGDFDVPHVDQPDFIDPAGDSITGWAYEAVAEIGLASGQVRVLKKVFAPVVGQATIDLDLVPDGPAGEPITAIVPAVTSVNGQTGAVVVSGGGGVLPGSPTAFELRGEGFPGSGSNATETNAASPGTYYTDTLGTNGAWRWLKTSAGTGTARWQVVFGRTGDRVMNASLINGWVMAGTPNLILSREGNLVTIHVEALGLDGVAASSAAFLTLPNGFRWARRTAAYTNLGVAHRWTPPGLAALEGRFGAGTSTLELPTGAGARYSFTVTFPTLDAWPSTLPGTP